jgi:hypothetical protein
MRTLGVSTGKGSNATPSGVIQGLPQGSEVLVISVPGVAAVGELLRRRDRVPRVPRGADPGCFPRVRSRPSVRRGAPLSLCSRGDSRPVISKSI